MGGGFVVIDWPYDFFCPWLFAEFFPESFRVSRRGDSRYDESANGVWVVRDRSTGDSSSRSRSRSRGCSWISSCFHFLFFGL